MRPTYPIVALAIVVSATQALQTQLQESDQIELNEQQHEAAFSSPPPSSLTPSSSSVQQPPEFPTAPAETVKSPLEVVKDAIQQIMIHLPSKAPEPLFETTATYCQAFNALCTLACKEKRQQKHVAVDDAPNGADVADKCENPQGTSIALAGAACRCMGVDLTERINTAIAGGATGPRSQQVERSATVDDPQNPISSVPMDLVRVMQSACQAIGLQGASKPVPAEAASVVGGVLSSVAGLIPGFGVVSALLPSIPLISKLIGSGGGDQAAPEGAAGLDPDLPTNATGSVQGQALLTMPGSKAAATIPADGSGEGKGPGGIVGWFTHVLGIDGH
ncbi:hypothetical protein BGZ70_009479 [Mortierella alpina]|uniref:Uncharacterized protein n=1 Tax=Mortierella alpina TaxID=64518 RepID=A0A9P6M0P5_MORAP|nr:hypothetical protein BGZ70_009479 [Mortierella alpina]